MAERLTEIGLFIDEPVYIIKKWKKSAAINKLAQLENILEKYGIESVEELSNALEFAKTIEQTLSEYGIKDNEELEELLDDNKYAQNVVVKQLVELQNAKNEENTWKKACELACKRICYMLDQEMQYHEHEKFNSEEYLKTEIDYFYQQAKKEKNENKN